MAGFKQPGSYGHDLLKKPEIQAAIRESLQEIQRQGIALRQNRVDELVERHRLLKQVIAERAEHDEMAGVPGGATGLVVRKLKTVKHTYDADPDDPDSRPYMQRIEQWESEIDTGLLRELREHEKHVAQELGEWVDRGELQHTGKDGGPMQFVSIDVPAPARPDGDTP